MVIFSVRRHETAKVRRHDPDQGSQSRCTIVKSYSETSHDPTHARRKSRLITGTIRIEVVCPKEPPLSSGVSV